MDEISLNSGIAKEEKRKFSFTKDVNGVSKTVRGEEVENGWVLTIDKEWKEKKDDGSMDYKYETKKYISKDNPFDSISKKEEETAISLIKDVLDMEGSLLVD
jgi:hypothetical protein